MFAHEPHEPNESGRDTWSGLPGCGGGQVAELGQGEALTGRGDFQVAHPKQMRFGEAPAREEKTGATLARLPLSIHTRHSTLF